MRLRKNREKYIEQLAINYLDSCHAYKFPLNALKLAFKNDILYDNYEELSNYLSALHQETIAVQDLVSEFGNAFVIASVKHKRYAIIYNNKTTHLDINWAVAHELGHILLKHVSTNKGKLNYMAELGTAPIEAEAEAFAGYLLSPDLILKEANILDPTLISVLCRIPPEKARRKHKQIQIGSFKNPFKAAHLL